MGICKNHPDRETSYKCFKLDHYLCESCLHCSDPEMYCQFRSSCIIFFLADKSGLNLEEKELLPSHNP